MFNKPVGHIANVALCNEEPCFAITNDWHDAVTDIVHLLVFADGGYWTAIELVVGAWIGYGPFQDGARIVALQATMHVAQQSSFVVDVTAASSSFCFLASHLR